MHVAEHLAVAAVMAVRVEGRVGGDSRNSTSTPDFCAAATA